MSFDLTDRARIFLGGHAPEEPLGTVHHLRGRLVLSELQLSS
jgi:hypothetical protein